MELGSRPNPERIVPEEAQAPQSMPRCPKCGWQDVRLSHNKGALDSALSVFSVSPFRCRSCGHRFYRVHRK